MATFFIKKEKIWPIVSWCFILTRRIDKPVSMVNIEKCGKFVQKLAEHSVSNIVHIHMADNYGHSAELITCHLALYESFEIERNDEGQGWIRVSIEFVTKLNVDDGRGHARHEKLVRYKGQRWRSFLKISNTELQCWVVNLHN